MSRVRCDIGKVIILVYESYKKNLTDKTIRKPVAKALYDTWKYVDSVEKERENE